MGARTGREYVEVTVDRESVSRSTLRQLRTTADRHLCLYDDLRSEYETGPMDAALSLWREVSTWLDPSTVKLGETYPEEEAFVRRTLSPLLEASEEDPDCLSYEVKTL